MTDPTSVPDFPPPGGQHPLRGRVLDVLLDEGFRPSIDDDGDVAVKVQGHQLFLRCVEGDVSLLRVFGQWRIGDADGAGPVDEADELLRLRACNAVAARLSVGKVVLAGDVLVASAEHLVTPGTPLSTLVEASFELVPTAVTVWQETLRELAEGPGSQA
ncbi:hypothetical protein [Angustibacter aerolatus]